MILTYIYSTVIFLAGNSKRVLLISRSIFKAAAVLSKTFAAVYLAFLTLEFFSKYLLILTALVLYLFYHSLLSFLTFYFWANLVSQLFCSNHATLLSGTCRNNSMRLFILFWRWAPCKFCKLSKLKIKNFFICWNLPSSFFNYVDRCLFSIFLWLEKQSENNACFW